MVKKIFLLTLFTLTFISISHAATVDAMTQTLCNVYQFITGGVGKAICSFVIVGVGIGFFTGKVSWGTLIGVTLGIASLFGGPSIMAAITGGDAPCAGVSYDEIGSSI